MSDTPHTVVAVDPGKLSGIAVVQIPKDLQSAGTKVFSAEEPWSEAVTTVLAAVDEYPDAVLVVESFIITQATLRKSFEPWSLYSIGALEHAMIMRGREKAMTLQSPATAKSSVSNDLLRALGLWHRGGAGHANDALRHAVSFALSRGWRPPNLSDTL